MGWYVHHHGHGVDLTRGGQFAKVVKRQLCAASSTSALACNAGRCERADQVPCTLAPIRPSQLLSAISPASRQNFRNPRAFIPQALYAKGCLRDNRLLPITAVPDTPAPRVAKPQQDNRHDTQ